MKVTFMPAAEKGYSQSDLRPSDWRTQSNQERDAQTAVAAQMSEIRRGDSVCTDQSADHEWVQGRKI